MSVSFDERYPSISWFVQEVGRIEIGYEYYTKSFIRVIDEGGMPWEGKETYDSIEAALDDAEAFLSNWMVEMGY